MPNPIAPTDPMQALQKAKAIKSGPLDPSAITLSKMPFPGGATSSFLEAPGIKDYMIDDLINHFKVAALRSGLDAAKRLYVNNKDSQGNPLAPSDDYLAQILSKLLGAGNANQ